MKIIIKNLQKLRVLYYKKFLSNVSIKTISTGQLKDFHPLHTQPIKLVVF